MDFVVLHCLDVGYSTHDDNAQNKFIDAWMHMDELASPTAFQGWAVDCCMQRSNIRMKVWASKYKGFLNVATTKKGQKRIWNETTIQRTRTCPASSDSAYANESFLKKKEWRAMLCGKHDDFEEARWKKNINHLPKHHDHVRREHNVWMEASVRMRANLMVTQTFRKHSQQVVLLKAKEIGCCIEPLQRAKRALQHAHCATGSHATAWSGKADLNSTWPIPAVRGFADSWLPRLGWNPKLYN